MLQEKLNFRPLRLKKRNFVYLFIYLFIFAGIWRQIRFNIYLEEYSPAWGRFFACRLKRKKKTLNLLHKRFRA